MSSAPHTPGHPVGRGRRRFLPIVVIAGVIAVLVAAVLVGYLVSDRSGTDGEPGDTDTATDLPERQLALGACVESLEHVAEDLLRQVPCAVRHQGQVVATQEITDAEFDGRSAYIRQAEEFCLPTAYQLVPDGVDTAALTIATIVPDASSWEDGDRTMRCLLAAQDDYHLTGSFLAADVQVHPEPM